MDVCKVNREDISEIASWVAKRGLNPIPESSIPEAGFIIRGIAALFVYLTDSDIAMLEGLISNPDESAINCHHAILKLIDVAEKYARTKRKRIWVMTGKESVSALVEKIGYRSYGAFELYEKGD